MKVVDCIQGSGLWLQQHVGRVTASRIKDVMDFTAKGQPGAKRKAYMAEKMAEILSGKLYQGKPPSFDMLRGIEFESDALEAYELARQFPIDRVGFVIHPANDRCGSSPDGLVGTDGGVEAKVPKIETHLRWLEEGTVPQEHRGQMVLGMICCERAWWDFISHVPEPHFPDKLRNFIVHLDYDEDEAEALDLGVRTFFEELDERMAKLQKKYGPFPLPDLRIATANNVPSQTTEEWLEEFSGGGIVP